MFDDRDRHGSFDDDFFKTDSSDLFKDWDKQWDRDAPARSVWTMSVSVLVYVVAGAVLLAVLAACCCAKRRRTRGQVISPPPPPPGPGQPAVYPQQQYSPYPTQPAPRPVAITFPVQSASPYPHVAPYPAHSPYPAHAPYPAHSPYPAPSPYPVPSPHPAPHPAAPSAPDAHALPPSYEQVMGQPAPSYEHKQPPFNPNAPR